METLPRRFIQSLGQDLINRFINLEQENEKLKQALASQKCVDCGNGFLQGSTLQIICEICERGVCDNCNYSATSDGEFICTNHHDRCGICLQTDCESPHKCTLCRVPICEKDYDNNRHSEVECQCGEKTLDCRQDNYYHDDIYLRVGKCPACGEQLCAHNQQGSCANCPRRCERCPNKCDSCNWFS